MTNQYRYQRRTSGHTDKEQVIAGNITFSRWCQGKQQGYINHIVRCKSWGEECFCFNCCTFECCTLPGCFDCIVRCPHNENVARIVLVDISTVSVGPNRKNTRQGCCYGIGRAKQEKHTTRMLLWYRSGQTRKTHNKDVAMVSVGPNRKNTQQGYFCKGFWAANNPSSYSRSES